MPRSHAAIALIALAATGCWTARTDARIDPGWHGGATVTAMATPDAVTTTPDGFNQGVPDQFDAAPGRAIVAPYLSYGWRRVELRVHLPELRASSRADYPSDLGERVYPTLAANLELYVKLLSRGRWHGGLAVEGLAVASAVATYELSAVGAISVTGRLVYAGNDGTRAQRRLNFGHQLQLSYLRTVGGYPVTGFAGAIVHTGRGDGLPLHARFTLSSGPSIAFHDAAYLGVGVGFR